MRIFLMAFIATLLGVCSFAFAADEGDIDTDQLQDHFQSKELPLNLELSSAVIDIDPVITGGTITSDYLSEWEADSALYHDCPQCVANQPFPDD